MIFLDVANGADVAIIHREDDTIRASVRENPNPRIFVDALSGKGFDSAITQKRSIFLAVCVADCAPVFIYDHHRKVFALAHAGLSGAVCGVVSFTIDVMRETFACHPKDMVVSIGPCISRDELDVKDSRMWNEVLEPAGASASLPPGTLIRQGDRLCFDIVGCVKWDLRQRGVPEAQIETSGICTVEERVGFFSDYAAAREGEAARAAEGRGLAIIGLK